MQPTLKILVSVLQFRPWPPKLQVQFRGFAWRDATRRDHPRERDSNGLALMCGFFGERPRGASSPRLALPRLSVSMPARSLHNGL
jgi:hypothetical protein